MVTKRSIEILKKAVDPITDSEFDALLADETKSHRAEPSIPIADLEKLMLVSLVWSGDIGQPVILESDIQELIDWHKKRL